MQFILGEDPVLDEGTEDFLIRILQAVLCAELAFLLVDVLQDRNYLVKLVHEPRAEGFVFMIEGKLRLIGIRLEGLYTVILSGTAEQVYPQGTFKQFFLPGKGEAM